MHWDRVPQLFGDIKGLLAEVFQWGQSRPPTRLCSSPRSARSSAAWRRACSRGRCPAGPKPPLAGHDVPEADTDPMLQVLLSIRKALDCSGLDVGLSLDRPAPDHGRRHRRRAGLRART